MSVPRRFDPESAVKRILFPLTSLLIAGNDVTDDDFADREPNWGNASP